MLATLEKEPELPWQDVLYTAAVGRTHFPSRAFITASGRADALEALGALKSGESHPGLTLGEARERGHVVFVFPGQGSQWVAMGRELLEQSEAFRDSITACDEALRPLTGWSLVSVLRGDDGDDVPSLERVDVIQPALFAMTIGLSALWRSLGVTPAAVVGHSQGEVGAAVVSGALSLEDAARVVVARSQLVRKISGRGGMLVVELPVADVEARIAAHEGALSIAVVNTATSTVVSGDTESLESLKQALEKEEVYCRTVNVDYASHSVHVDEIIPELLEELGSIAPKETHTPFYATVTGRGMEGTELDATDWCRNGRVEI